MGCEVRGHLITNRASGGARAKSKELRDADPLRTGVARLLRKHTDERAWRIGADGEESVGSRLNRLDQTEWLALHDIVLNDKGTNLDHLVIGPGGVFVGHRPIRGAQTRVVRRRRG